MDSFRRHKQSEMSQPEVQPRTVARSSMSGRLTRRAIVVAAIAASIASGDGPCGLDGRSASADGQDASVCDCTRFADELAAARALYASRGDGATMPLTTADHDRFRDRVL